MFIISFSIPVFASESGETDIINEMISYYSTYQSTAKTDIQRLVEKLKALNSTKGEEWEKNHGIFGLCQY